MPSNAAQILDAITGAAIRFPSPPTAANYRPLVNWLADRDFILLGESTHGTAEFYQARIDITKELIRHHAVSAIAIEGDWPSAYRVNRYVRGGGADGNAAESLGDFTRFPLWMWRNTLMLDFIEWLREHNANVSRERQTGFYGLDMYSMYESIAAVLEYLDQVDPETARHARRVYACLDHVDAPQTYGYGVNLGRRPSCEREVIKLLTAMRERSMAYVTPGDSAGAEDLFAAEQNARLVQSAEHYYRQMFDGRTNTWNLRDSHMLDTLDNLQAFLSRSNGTSSRMVVWAHNSHVGDARATYMGAVNQHNLGQLVRQKNSFCTLVGFTTYVGKVTAASEWDAPAQCKRVRPGLPGSIEAVFHDSGIGSFMVPLQGDVKQQLGRPFLQRAIGVLYLPETERSSHYFQASLSRQFDWVIHFDKTSALEPLDPVSEWVEGEQQTYPFGV